jgi:hypothetical protein
MTALEAARLWDEALADWIRFDSLGVLYRGARDRAAERMTLAMDAIVSGISR